MKKIFLILLILAGCGRGDEASDNLAGPDSPVRTADSKAVTGASTASARLGGLYEGGKGPRKNQLCIAEKASGAQFGLLVWGGGLTSCSGAGQAVREGERLTLRMAGDSTCAIAAALRDGTVTLPASLPAGCAYYCAPGATLAGARLARSGDDVKAARDIAGDPLCD